MGDSMIDFEVQENYWTCCRCEFCGNITLHTEKPFIAVGCGKAGTYLYDDDKCPVGKWNTEE